MDKEGQEWQRNLNTPLERLTFLLNKHKLSDLTINLPRHSNSTFKVHQMVLAMSSPVWEEQLDRTPIKGVLSLFDTTPETLSRVLRYLYSGDTSFTSTTQAVQVAHFAHAYKIYPLYSVCCQFLGANLNKDCVLDAYNVAFISSNTGVLHQCLKILKLEGNEVLSSRQILTLCPEALQHLLQQRLFVKSEVVIFRAMMAWAKGKLEARNVAVNTETLMQEVKDVLPYVRLLTMTMEEIVQQVIPSGVLTPEENMILMQHIRPSMQNLPPLPPVICSLREKREVFDPESLTYVLLPAMVPETETGFKRLHKHKQVLISEMRVNRSVVVLMIECKSIHVEGFTAKVMDSRGQTVQTTEAVRPGLAFEPPLELNPALTTTIHIFINEVWYPGLHNFEVENCDVVFQGEVAPLSQGPVVFYWRMNE